MTWTKVKDLLITEVISLMSDPAKGEAWLDLLRSSPDGPRLGACICIDIRSGGLSPSVFASILDLLTFPLTDARKAYAKALKNHPLKDSLSCASNFAPNPLDDGDCYVRVQELGKFIMYYAGPSAGYSSTDPDDLREVRSIYFNEGRVEDWPDLDQEFTGSDGRVFVLSENELKKLIDGAVDKGWLVNDSIGLGIRNGIGIGGKPEFVAVRYPADFSGKCVQPTTLDAGWENPGWYYVSQGDVDSWGKTQSCSGTGVCVRERVHKGLKKLESGFSGFLIGIANAALIENRLRLLEEAYKRIP